MKKYWKAWCLFESGIRYVTRAFSPLIMKTCPYSFSPSGLLWKVRSLLDMMNGVGMDQYRRVAFLLWRNEKLAGNMMAGDMEGLGRCWCWLLVAEVVLSWQCLSGLDG